MRSQWRWFKTLTLGPLLEAWVLEAKRLQPSWLLRFPQHRITCKHIQGVPTCLTPNV